MASPTLTPAMPAIVKLDLADAANGWSISAATNACRRHCEMLREHMHDAGGRGRGGMFKRRGFGSFVLLKMVIWMREL
jgi:hypothetical protein